MVEYQGKNVRKERRRRPVAFFLVYGRMCRGGGRWHVTEKGHAPRNGRAGGLGSVSSMQGAHFFFPVQSHKTACLHPLLLSKAERRFTMAWKSYSRWFSQPLRNSHVTRNGFSRDKWLVDRGKTFKTFALNLAIP